ncbi:MAG: HNH endonuclease [Deltaproteobacteria bacterium]|nr:HNH endonuclease [Deltaproteobacteria bacterium]
MEREGQRCAYCRSPMLVGIPMIVDHIVPLAAGGSSTSENLCLACYRCNEFKGPRTEARDPYDGRQIPLFHPRQQQWRDHFAWGPEGETIVGLIPLTLALSQPGEGTWKRPRYYYRTWTSRFIRVWARRSAHR